ncbi:MAG TPA: glycosyltransferase family 87 protein [Cyclobacteriaceae bacterium]|jgi:hypothetical protein
MKRIKELAIQFWTLLTAAGPEGQRFRKRMAIILGLIIIGLWVNMVLRANRGHGSQYDDFTGFSQDLIFDRINIYKEYAFESTSIGKYPPFFGLVYAPVAIFPLVIGASIWFWFSIVLVVYAGKSVAMGVSRLSGETGQVNPLLWSIPLALGSIQIITNLETAQVNILIFSLVAFAIARFADKKDVQAGLLLGMATAIKLTPGLFVVYFAYKGAWRVVLWAAIGGAICWFMVLPVVMGFTYYYDVMQSWVMMVGSFVSDGASAEGIAGFRHTNQSLSAAFHRFFTETPAGGGIENFYINIVRIPHETAGIIVKSLNVAILIVLAWICRTPLGDRKDPRLPLELSLVMIATLFLSPISWINHYVVMILAFGAAVYYIRAREYQDLNRKMMLQALIIAATLIMVSPRISQAFSLPFFGAVILAVALAKGILRGKKEMIAKE